MRQAFLWLKSKARHGFKITLLRLSFGGFDMEKEIDKGVDHGPKRLDRKDNSEKGGNTRA